MKKQLTSINDKICLLGKMVETSMDHSTVSMENSALKAERSSRRIASLHKTGRQDSQPN